MEAHLFRNSATSALYRRSSDAAWPPLARAYGGQSPPQRQTAKDFALAAARLLLPILLTLVLLAAVYLYGDAVLPLEGWPQSLRRAGLASSDLVLPATWVSIHLTNRRFGPAYAFAQLLAVLGLAAMAVLIDPYGLDEWVTGAPDMRAVFSFGAAFFLANVLAIAVFDGARGRRWWTAPLAGSLAASLAFSAIYYPAAFAGVRESWADAALVHFLLFSVLSLALLGPYWLLRPAMRPEQGLNGY